MISLDFPPLSPLLAERSKSSGRRTVSMARAACVCFGAVATVAACGGEDTYTPDACPPQHEYDIRELYAEENLNDPDVAKQRAQIEAEVEAAAKKGCVTKPTFTPVLKD
jgi:hypothetical protein